MTLFFLILWFRCRLTHKNTVAAIEKWAKELDLRVVKLEQPLIVPLWHPGRGYRHFRVTLEGTDHGIRKCWISSPTFAFRWAGDEPRLQVKWIDEEKRKQM